MRQVFIGFIIYFLTLTGCYGQANPITSNENPLNNEADMLDFYRQFSTYTDPGEYAYLYADLPDALPELCSLIKAQTIHPYVELPGYRDQISRDRWREFMVYETVASILQGLVSYDSSGFTTNREPEHRLILGCQQNALLLASILKYRSIPARVRSGHATYLIPNFHASHTVCEVWNEQESRWMLVDPSTNMIDFDRDKFDYSYEAWLQLRKDELDPDVYGNPGQYTGIISIVGKLSPDLAAVLGTEYPITHYAPVLETLMDSNNSLSAEQMNTLDRISELMETLDVKNLVQLHEIYNNTPELQISKSFTLPGQGDHAKAGNNNH